MSDERMTRDLQKKLLEIMEVFHDVCEKHGITYFIIGGTLLGAVRHQGFIPWDDDMDVGLPRPDYEKLLKLPESEWPSNIRIKTPNNSRDLIFPYSKIMDSNTTLVEDKLDGIIEGVYIDIFPLDGAGKSAGMAKLRFWYSYWKLGLLYYNQYKRYKRNIVKKIIQMYAKSKDVRKIYSDLERHMTSVSYNSSKIIGNYAGAWGYKEFVKKEVLEVPELYDFEGFKFYGVSKPHDYLTSLYGDYMKLPPLEKRKSHHRFKYINLNLPFIEYDNLKDKNNESQDS